MSVKLNPYLTFQTNAREAMEYYHKVFGGDLKLQTFGEFPDPPAGHEKNIMHGLLETGDLTIMASDGMPGGKVKFGDNVSLSLSGDDHDALSGYFDQLADGGTIRMPLAKQVWGDEFGMLTDQFGIHWMININAAKSE